MNVHSHEQPEPDATHSTKQAILDAALVLFADKGFHGTAVPEIARAAGIAAGTIYRHFAGKEQLVNALYCDCKASLMTTLLAGFPFDAAPRAQFHALWQRLAAFARREPRAFFFLELHHHAPYLDDRSQRLEQDSLRPIGDFIARTATAGVTKPMPPAALVSIVWGAFVGLVRAQSQGYLELTDELLTQTEAACWDAVSAH